MRRPGFAIRSALLAAGAISLSLLGTTTSAFAAGSGTTQPVGTHVAELTGSDTVAGDSFGNSVAISGTTAIVGAYLHAKSAGQANVFTNAGDGWKETAELSVPGSQ